MLIDLLEGLTRHLDAIAYVALVVVLVAVAIHADRRYDEERTRNEVLQRRIRSLTLVVRFQDTMLKVDEPAPPVSHPEVLDLSVDAMIRQLGYCLTCHRLKAPAHFVDEPTHVRLEDDQHIPDIEERA